MGEDHQRRFCSVGGARRVLHRYCGTSAEWRPPEPLSDHVPSFSESHFLRNRVSVRKGGNRRSRRSPVSLFVAGVRDSQALGFFKNDSQHEADQPSSGKGSFPNGSSGNHPSVVESSRRRGFFGSSRRLFSYTDTSAVAGPSGVCLPGQILPIQSAPVRVAPCSSDFHEGRGVGHGVFEKTGPSSFRLSGRLAVGRKVGGSVVGSCADSDQHDSRSWISHKLGEIGVRPDSHAVLPRCSAGHSSSAGSSQSRQGRDDSQDGSFSESCTSGESRALASVAGVSLQSSRRSSRLSSIDETFPTLSDGVLSAEREFSFDVGPPVVQNQGSSRSLASSFLPPSGQTLPSSSPFRDRHHGRVVVGLGRSLPGVDDFRRLESSGRSASHQCVRTHGSVCFASSFPCSSGGSLGSDTYGQRVGDGVHQQTGRHSFCGSERVGLSTLGVVQGGEGVPDCITYPGRREYHSGLSLQRQVPSLGVDSVSDCLQATGESVRCSRHRSLRNFAQPSSSSVLFESPGTRSFCSGRFRDPVGGVEGLRFSPVRIDSPCAQEDQGRSSDGDSHSSLVAGEVVVSGPPDPPGGDSVVVAMSSGSGVATSVRYSTPAAGNPPSDCLAIIGERARLSGFSERAAQFLVQSRRESTRTVYNSRLDAFHAWCEEVGVAPREASLPSIADFLISLYDKGRALSTIRGYRSAIAAVHAGFADGTSVSSAPQLAALLKSFSLKRPFFRPLTPAWSLPKVLEALARPPFEPLCSATLLHTTIKTVFLMAIASGQRRSSLHALSVAPGHIRWEGRGVRLIPKASFIAKNQSDTSGSVEVVLHPLSDFSSVSGDKLWCPVRALKWYLHKTKPFRKSDQLFLVSREPHSAASRDTISRWLVLAIKAAGPEALTPGRTPRAHDTRSVSTSWALFNGVSVRDICKAAFWKSPSSFTAFYLKDVPAGERAFAVASLKAASSSISH